MYDFSNIYEKLIDMGFSTDAIDVTIKKGLYTFDKIFNELVETDNSLKSYVENKKFNKNNFLSQPILKLRSKQTSIFDGSIEDKLNDAILYDVTESSANDGLGSHNDYKSLFAQLNRDDNNAYYNIDDSTFLATTSRLDHYSKRLRDQNGDYNSMVKDNSEQKICAGTNFTKGQSSTMSSSLLSNNTMELYNKKLTKIQIMDLLDPANEPITYTHTFLASICTIRDLICWYQQCRSTATRKSLLGYGGNNLSRLAISSDTGLRILIEMFQQLKWHLVLPSGANSIRIYGQDNLDKALDKLGLTPHAHLLAIISCPLELKDSSYSISQTTKPNLNQNDNQSILISSFDRPVLCHVEIRMINYRHNPLYLQGKAYFTQDYDPNQTILQRVALDFSSFCQIDIGSYTLLQMQPSRQFSTDDYRRSLTELGIESGNVTFYCHVLSSIDKQIRNFSTIDNDYTTKNNHNTNTHMNTNDNHDIDTSGNNNNTLNTMMEEIGYFNVSDVMGTPTNTTRSHSYSVLPFSGIGVPLLGLPTNQTVAQIWSNRPIQSLKCDESLPMITKHSRSPKNLFHLCFQEIYRSLKNYNNVVCRIIKKLPNNFQQVIIKQLMEEKLLTANILTFFCAPGSCLTSLDLSYSILATNEVLKCIGRCVTLQELVLDNEDHVFSNEGLWHLRYCSALTRLSLNYCSKINDWGIQVVAVLPVLSVLSIKYTAVTNVGLKHIYLHFNADKDSIVDTPLLRSVDLSGLTISDDCLGCIAIFSRLELLNISSTRVTNPSLFPHLPYLRHIDISNCHELLWDKIKHIKCLCEKFPQLTSINARGISVSNLCHITMAISHCKNLRQLDGIFCHSQMTASLAASLSHLPLETIILTNCCHVTDLWLPVLARFSATLTHLVLSSCSSIKGENNSLVKNLSRLRNLSWLDLTHLENVNVDQIFQLVVGNYFSKLQVLWISLTDAEEVQFRTLKTHLNFKVNVTKSLVKLVK